MTLIEKIRTGITEGDIPPIFMANDLNKVGIEDANHNISNYDKKNKGAQNKHNTVLISRTIDNKNYYSFDEQLFE